MPDRRYFQALSRETGYIRDTLEKSYRLAALVREVYAHDPVGSKLALKSGTALHFIHLDFQRLSVDIDFNYIGSLELEKMRREREDIRDWLAQLFSDQGYALAEHNSMHSEEQFILSYQSHGGNRDYLKLEINYSERLPVLPVGRMPLKLPFSGLDGVFALAYKPEENFAQKTRALLARGTPRDLFDVYLIADGARPFDTDLYRKITIFYCLLAPTDLRKLRNDRFDRLTELDLKRHLLPLLSKKKARFDLALMKLKARGLAERVLSFSEGERAFLDAFYDRKRFEPDRLFDSTPVTSDLSGHPMIRFRLGKMG